MNMSSSMSSTVHQPQRPFGERNHELTALLPNDICLGVSLAESQCSGRQGSGAEHISACDRISNYTAILVSLSSLLMQPQ